jgi:sulfur carrier protein ThiS
MKNKLIISVHDVSSKNIKELLKIRETLNKLGINKVEYAVLMDASPLPKEIKKLKNENVCLHGKDHYGKRKYFWNSLLFGKNHPYASEFSGINKKDLKNKLDYLTKEFKKNFSKYPKKLIPPRWENYSQIRNELKNHGIDESETYFYLRNTKSNKKIFSLACCFDYGESLWLTRSSRIWVLFFVFLSGLFKTPLRYTIHPADLYNGNFEFEIRLLKRILKKDYKLVNTGDIWKNEAI